MNNISRENITIAGLAIDGGMDESFVARAQIHCGEARQTFAGDPCPPCASEPGDGFRNCGWNNFGILLWDYHAGGAVRNVRLAGLHIYGCSMGLHVLGTTNITVEDSVLEYNGNGNAFFHNAYLLRVVSSVLRNCTFHGSTGHGLKITSQNDTLIEDCTVTGNRWQGIWVGSESPMDNFGLRIHRTRVAANHMYGVQLSATNGFEVINSTFQEHPNPAMAGLGILYSRNGIIVGTTVTGNAVNLRLQNAHNISLHNMHCNESFLFNASLCYESATYTTTNTNCKPCPPRSALHRPTSKAWRIWMPGSYVQDQSAAPGSHKTPGATSSMLSPMAVSLSRPSECHNNCS